MSRVVSINCDEVLKQMKSGNVDVINIMPEKNLSSALWEKVEIDKCPFIPRFLYKPCMIHIAAYYGKAALTSRLIERGAAVDIQTQYIGNYHSDDGCFTPLHLAVLGGDFDTIKMLVEKGNAPLLIEDWKERTPHKLAENMRIEYLKKGNEAKAQEYNIIMEYLQDQLSKRKNDFMISTVTTAIVSVPNLSLAETQPYEKFSTCYQNMIRLILSDYLDISHEIIQAHESGGIEINLQFPRAETSMDSYFIDDFLKETIYKICTSTDFLNMSSLKITEESAMLINPKFKKLTCAVILLQKLALLQKQQAISEVDYHDYKHSENLGVKFESPRHFVIREFNYKKLVKASLDASTIKSSNKDLWKKALLKTLEN